MSSVHILTVKGLMSYLYQSHIVVENTSTTDDIMNDVLTFTAYPAGSEWRKLAVKLHIGDMMTVMDMSYTNRSGEAIDVYSVDMELEPEVSVSDLLFGFVHAIENN